MPETELLEFFRFSVEIVRAQSGQSPIVRARFSEVSGLELTVETDGVREGGYNVGVHNLVKRVAPAPIVLKRGVTEDTAFWDWVSACFSGEYPLPYVDGVISVLQSDERRVTARWKFHYGIVSKVVAPPLNALGSSVPIEEVHIVHEALERLAAPFPPALGGGE